MTLTAADIIDRDYAEQRAALSNATQGNLLEIIRSASFEAGLVNEADEGRSLAWYRVAEHASREITHRSLNRG